MEQNEKTIIRLSVEAILRSSEKARNNDTYLYSEVLKHLGLTTDVSRLADLKGVPAFATVIRYRRQLQCQHESLRASSKVQKLREDNISNYKDIAKEVTYVTPRDV